MTTQTLPLEAAHTEEFQTGEVITIVGGHFVHDTFTAFLPTLLPLIIEKLGISLTLAGALNAVSQIPALLNPLIGLLADRLSLRYFVIFAPAVTATFYASLGLAPTPAVLGILLFAGGISTTIFHAPAPAMIGRISGRRIGTGMSLFMAGGELGRTLGPLLAVWAVSTWTLEGSYRVMLLGWAAAAVLYWRLRGVAARSSSSVSVRGAWGRIWRLFLPLSAMLLFRNFLVMSLSVYLPTYMTQSGSSLWIAASALTLFQGAGVAGAFASGPVSDRLGRKTTLAGAVTLAALFMLAFLNVQGWLQAPMLLLLGFAALSMQPVTLAIVQECFPDHRAFANSLVMLVSFLVMSASTITVGALGENFGLRTAFTWSAFAALLALPAIYLLPLKKR